MVGIRLVPQTKIETATGINLELVVSFGDINEILERVRRNKKLNFDIKSLSNYLVETIILIENRRGNIQELKDHYVVSSCIYVFGKPFLGLNILEGALNNFEILIRRKYGIRNCLYLFFQRVGYDKEIEEEYQERDIKKLINIGEGSGKAEFKGTKNSIDKLVRGITDLIPKLENPNEYNEKNHLLYSGLNLCLSWLEGNKKRKQFEETSKMLKQTYGEFVFELPDSFVRGE